ncbi:hypothetical protein ANCDUO_03478 [Ancylostoma duodenale]|uniref:Uncharacterized protein n=1 Tax=Ancylostoma duodenale TaxID=51022 RepID=A0A0C2GXE0_9BILA|nr:hypothetical protein ANCDUO_03478 [Ancylostoma duodenale]
MRKSHFHRCTSGKRTLTELIAGHLESHHKCTSQSYCVSVKSRNGLVQRSCDVNVLFLRPSQSNRNVNFHSYVYQKLLKFPILVLGNSMAHISLCALSPVRRRVTNGDFIYGSSGAPNHHQTRTGRHQQLDMNCFNGGDLGEVCCCSTGFCNSASSTRWIAVIAVLVLFLG